MKKLVGVLLILIILGAFTSCDSSDRTTAEVEGPYELILLEKDNYHCVTHKILFNTETKLYYEYFYFYSYDGCYRNISKIEYITYDKDGNIVVESNAHS